MLPSPTPRRGSAWLVQLLGYAAAPVLPAVAARLSLESHVLRGTPLALSFVLLALITVLSGLGPGILAAVSAALAFNHLVLAPPRFLSIRPAALVYTAAIFLIGLVVAFLFERQRIIGGRLQATLRSLQARTDSLMEAQQASNAAAWMFSTDDRRLYWAEGGAHVLGRPSPEDETLDAFLSVIHEEDRDRFSREYEAAIATSRSFHLEFRIQLPDGHIHWLESGGTPSAADPKIWHGVTLDITDRKRAEAALVRSEKLAAIGRLSATVAHEVNNPLEAVTNLLYLAMAEPGLPPKAKDYLQRADHELARLATIARRTLTFVRPKSSAGPVDVVETVESVIDMFQPRCAARGAEIRIRRNVELTLPMPADDLRQILTNIVSNACDALPPSGGIIEIEIVRHDKTASISIRDNGAGIAPENLSRVFEPFFTTKEDVGTGIGLWVTRDLVDKNGGRISVQTQYLPHGFHTMFRVEFPLV
jgi:PAS domain S-box-containing protein